MSIRASYYRSVIGVLWMCSSNSCSPSGQEVRRIGPISKVELPEANRSEHRDGVFHHLR